MSFGNPLWLWGLCAPAIGVVVLAVLFFVRRRARAVRWPGIKRVVAANNGLRPIPARGGMRRPWLLLAALACVIIALARPRWGEIEEPVFQQAREVMIALDLSRSMLAQDVPPSRLERARLLVRTLLDGLRGERVGLVVFAGTSFVQVPLSADYQILGEFLPELKPDYMPQGGTDYTGMLRAAAGGFSDTANTDRYLIVLSDGESTTEGWREELDAVKKRGVRVIALGVGTPAGAFIPDGKGGFVKDERGAVVLSRLEPATLQELASQTRGVYRDASAWLDLPGLLAETVERGRAGAFTEQRSVKHIERFQWFLAPALVLGLLGLWREVAVRPRLRTIQRRATQEPARPEAGSATAVSALLVAIAGLLIATLPARAGVVRTDPPSAGAGDSASAVRKTVTRVAASSQPRASDWRALAEQTLAYGNEARAAKKPIERGAILDALDAVDLGEKEDPRAADWPKLRESLKALLEKPPEQNQQQQQQNQQQQQQKDQQQKQQDQQQGSGSDQKKDQQQQQQQQQSQQNEQQKKEDDSDAKQQQQNQSQQQQQQQQSGQSKEDQQNKSGSPDQKPPQTSGGEMGELKDEPKDPTKSQQPEQQQPQPAKEETRKFGGRPAGEPAPQPTNPDDAAALQRLRQVGDQDSPAHLYELIEGNTKQGAASGRDW